jgi:hypothetical protein
MKKGFLIRLISSITISMFSQSSVGKIRLRPEYYQTDLKEKDLEKLKDAKTYFVMPSQFSSDYSLDRYKDILDEVWTVSEIEIIEEKDISDYVKIGNVFLRFKSRSVRTGKASYVFNYFKLGVVNKIKEKKKGGFEWWEDFYGVVFFTTNVEARLDMAQMKDTINGDLLDYRLGYIKNYLQQLNEGIKESVSYNIYDDYVDESEIKKLKNRVLLIPDNILYGYNALTGKERRKFSEDIFEDYEYEYEVIDENDLSEKILNDDESFYYLMYHQKNAHKMITIVEGSTGKIIYRRHTNLSYNIKAKDIKSLMKRINKS